MQYRRTGRWEAHIWSAVQSHFQSMICLCNYFQFQPRSKDDLQWLSILHGSASVGTGTNRVCVKVACGQEGQERATTASWVLPSRYTSCNVSRQTLCTFIHAQLHHAAVSLGCTSQGFAFRTVPYIVSKSQCAGLMIAHATCLGQMQR